MSYVRNLRISPEEFKGLVNYEQKANWFTRNEAKSIAEKYHVCIPVGVLDKKYSAKRGYFSYDEADYMSVDSLVERANIGSPASVPVPAEKPVEAPLVNEIKRSVVTAPATSDEDDNAAELVPSALRSEDYAKDHFVPSVNSFYVKNGTLHDDLSDVISAGIFFPVYVTGLTGNGKTFTVDQVGAYEKREVIRVNITSSTDEDDLIGGFRLYNGSTVWEDGPVIMAMKRGATLLLDEIDLGTDKIMCLQGVLEGNPVYIKKINKKVYPEAGFNVVATGNTKGKSDATGQYSGTRILNEALLDRFSITLEQEYPVMDDEMIILKRAYKNIAKEAPSKDDVNFMDRIAKTAELIRIRYAAEEISDVISTRRLVDMVKSYIIFSKNRVKAFNYCTSRFEDADAIRDVYLALDVDAYKVDPVAPAPVQNNPSQW